MGTAAQRDMEATGFGWSQPVLLSAAFWVAWLRFDPRLGPRERLRYALALVAGALFAHFGWAASYPAFVWQRPALLWTPSGFSLLFIPLGIGLVQCWSGPAGRRRRLAAGLEPLPLALAVARLGCLAAGCCAGLPLGGHLAGARHPVAFYEIAGLLVLSAALRRAPARARVAAVLCGIGGLRLLLDGLRMPPALGQPTLPPSWVATALLAAGLVYGMAGARPVGSRRLLPLPSWDRTGRPRRPR